MKRLLAAGYALNLVDAAQTHFAVGGGYAREVNPLMAWVIEAGGWGAFWAVKVGIIVLFLLLYAIRQHASARAAAWFAAGMFGFASVWGLLQLAIVALVGAGVL